MKIKKLKITNNRKIGNIELDFTKNGKIQDTIILAGNNGSGKTTILEEILSLVDHSTVSGEKNRTDETISAVMELTDEELKEIKENIKNADYGNINEGNILTNEVELKVDFNGQIGTYDRYKIYVNNNGKLQQIDSYNILHKGKLEKIMSVFYSSASIDYNLGNISNITTIDLDDFEGNLIISSRNSGNQIKQTFIDISNLDAQDFQKWAKNHIGETVDSSKMDIRLKRFTDAFKFIMKDLELKEIENEPNSKEVIFERNGNKIKMDELSTGEKQIIIRGGFLLRFLKKIQGSLILIDEPELSLHPEWQKKILNFYKKLFINDKGEQTSQIFVATHSPFIINNSSRYNDKVIVLNRNIKTGLVETVNKPTYYECDNNVYIQDAFDINDFNKEENILFTEGETDKKYLDKAIELFLNNKVSFKVEWIGNKNNSGNLINTGAGGLNNLLKVLEANKNLFSKKIGLLFDCDTNKNEIVEDKYFTYTLTRIEGKVYKRGIENILNLPSDFNYEEYNSKTVKEDEYGVKTTIGTLNKVKLCDFICNSPEANIYLMNIEKVIKEVDEKMKK